MPLMAIPGFGELILIFAVVVLLFGSKKLPALGGAIGESIKNFKKGIKDADEAKALEQKNLAEKGEAPKAPQDQPRDPHT